MLDAFIPEPRLVEIDHADVVGRPEVVDAAARRLDFHQSPLIHALFALRSIPARVRGHAEPTPHLRLGEIGRSGGAGFVVLADEPGRSLTVGAVGRFWQPDIDFVALTPDRFAAFDEPGYGKVAWQIRFEPLGDQDTRVVFELRVTATDDAAWAAQCRYFRLIGPFSHFLRRHTLAMLRRELGTPEAVENERSLPGDELIAEEATQVTQAITIAAPPERIWPWLVQMGSGRGGWYSHDTLDNAGRPSARVIVPELQHIEVGQVLPAAPDSHDGFTVLRIEQQHALVLGRMHDIARAQAGDFFGELPRSYWRMTWAFVLLPLDDGHTRLLVRGRIAFRPPSAGWEVMAFARPVHHFMQAEQLRNLAARAEGTLPHHHDGPREIAEGVGGMLRMLAAFATPFLRRRRAHWGLSPELAAREYPGDAFVGKPRWSWTHAIEIDAPPTKVWPWIAQIGRDKAGLYSYQWLENIVGLDFQNAENVVEEWQHPMVGEMLALGPDGTGLPIVAIDPGRYLLAQLDIDLEARPATPEPRFALMSWLFFLEPLDDGRRCRVVSRWRIATSDDLATRIAYGPLFVEPIGGVMDRRMLQGIKRRAEHAATG